MGLFAASLLYILLPSIVVAAPTQKQSRPLVSKFSSLVVFGDSYTDDGVYNYTPPVAHQKTNGSTGGRVWPQYIQQYTGVNLYNYAHSGDVCDKIVLNVNNHGIKQNQIPSFLVDNEWRNSTTGEPALVIPAHETVYAMWIGTNDLSNSGFLTEVEPPGMPLTYYTDCVYEQFDRLYEAGGRVFVFMNIAPINLSPQYGLPWAGGLEKPVLWPAKMAYDPNITQTSEKMRQYLTMANSVFDYRTPYEMLIGKRYPGSTFSIFNIHGLITDIYNNPSEYLNGTAPYNVTSSVYACGVSCAAEDTIRDSYLWNNDLHPSEQTDRVIAREFINVVKGQSKWVTSWRS